MSKHADLVKAVKDALSWDQWNVVAIQGVYNSPGIWDLYVDTREKHFPYVPRVVWLEIKIGKDKLSDDQVEFAKQRREKGVECYVIRDIEDLGRLCLLSNRIKF